MTEAAPDVAAGERRALWLEVIRWPLKGGMLGGVVLLTGIAYLLSRFESGASPSARETAGYIQGGLGLVAVAVLGHYAWRAISCTYPTERSVPWFGDEAEGKSVGERATTFGAVFVISFLLLFAWLGLRGPIGAPKWIDALAIVATSAFGATLFPLGLAGAVARGTALAALPGPVLLMWRAAPRAARIAWVTAVVFVGLLLASSLVAALATAHLPNDANMAGTGRDPMSEWVRWTIFALRAAGLYAGLVSFRVAGLFVREVPGIRQVIG